jgi:hypothetical protein
MLPSSPMHIATLPAALPEKLGPQELTTDSRRSSAKAPVEQAPSGIAETMMFIRTEPDGAKRFECPRGHNILFSHP